MAVTIRQEVNVLTAKITGSVASNSNEIIQLDTTQYVNPTYYFEADIGGAASNTGTVTLRRNGTVTDDASLTGRTTATITRVRSTAFTPPVGQTEYIVRNNADGTRSQTINSARIIVIDSPTTLTSSETQIEIGMNKTGLVSTTAVKVVPDTTLTKYWKYTAAKWDGTKTFYAEVTYLMASSKSSGTFVLQEDDGSFGTWTDKVTIVNAGIASVATRTRSLAFTPTDGRNYRIAYLVASSKSAASIYNAKIIVDQKPTSINTYYFDAHLNTTPGTPDDPDAAWTNDANAFDGSTATAATTPNGNIGSTSSRYLQGAGTTAPSSGGAITQVRARLYVSNTGPTIAAIMAAAIYTSGLAELLGTPTANTDLNNWGSYSILSAPSLGWSWSVIQALVTKAYISVNGNAATDSLYRIEIEVTDSSSPPTLLEPQYLLLNTADSNVTGVQSYQTLWDSTEWSGVTNVYTHAMDSDNASNSAKLRDITGAVDITSTVTGANQQISSAITMPTTGHEIDTWILNTTGVVGASRILVASTVSSVVNATIAQVAGTVTATGGTQTVLAVSPPILRTLVINQAINRSNTY